LIRLGIVLDTRNPPGRFRETAAMCDGAGIDALWVRDHLSAPDSGPRLEAWTALTLAATSAVRSRVGVTLAAAFRPVRLLAAMAGTLDAAVGGRLELALSIDQLGRDLGRFGSDTPAAEGAVSQVERYARDLRTLLSGEPAALGGDAEAEPGVASPQPGGPPISVEARTSNQMDVAARVADDVIVRAGVVSSVDDAVALVREACVRSERDPATLGIALEVPVSIGRTRAEADARARGEALFDVVGQPAQAGIFGTLEECQDRVIGLAHAGVTDLRCVLPNNPDIHDVIAQVTAIAIGTVDVLAPGTPRSQYPDPPETWGGRTSRPAAG
jgi:alkanesulfonate monooxygenase SsuD/methylene tetrahydromethanopterin reductase-like flavin-dependent oxidoreductase (luciferase family)